MNHQTRPVQVWVDCDLGIAAVVEYLQTIPGVRTHASCEGTIDAGGPQPYRAQVMATWTDEALDRLQREFDVEVLGDHWGYLRPRQGAPAGWQPPGEREMKIAAELWEARETIKRLNRRCQIAEAAANTKVEDAEKRSQRGIRAYMFELGRIHGQQEAANRRGEPHQAPAGWQPSSALLVKLREQIEQSIIDARSLPMLGATSIAGHERERGRLAAYEEILSVLRADEILVEICPRCGERCPAGWCGACHKPTMGIRPARCTCGASVTGHPHIKDCPASLPPAPSLPEGDHPRDENR